MSCVHVSCIQVTCVGPSSVRLTLTLARIDTASERFAVCVGGAGVLRVLLAVRRLLLDARRACVSRLGRCGRSRARTLSALRPALRRRAHARGHGLLHDLRPTRVLCVAALDACFDTLRPAARGLWRRRRLRRWRRCRRRSGLATRRRPRRRAVRALCRLRLLGLQFRAACHDDGSDRDDSEGDFAHVSSFDAFDASGRPEQSLIHSGARSTEPHRCGRKKTIEVRDGSFLLRTRKDCARPSYTPPNPTERMSRIRRVDQQGRAPRSSNRVGIRPARGNFHALFVLDLLRCSPRARSVDRRGLRRRTELRRRRRDWLSSARAEQVGEHRLERDDARLRARGSIEDLAHDRFGKRERPASS